MKKTRQNLIWRLASAKKDMEVNGVIDKRIQHMEGRRGTPNLGKISKELMSKHWRVKEFVLYMLVSYLLFPVAVHGYHSHCGSSVAGVETICMLAVNHQQPITCVTLRVTR